MNIRNRVCLIHPTRHDEYGFHYGKNATMYVVPAEGYWTMWVDGTRVELCAETVDLMFKWVRMFLSSSYACHYTYATHN